MYKKLMFCFLTSSIAAISVIVIELGTRSAVLSPFLLTGSEVKNANTEKILIGYSAYQGDYLLGTYTGKFKHSQHTISFKAGQTHYVLDPIEPEHISWALFSYDTKTINFVTRHGIIANISNYADNSSNGLLFNNKTVSLKSISNDPLSVTIESQYNKKFIALLFFISIFCPGLLFLIFNIKKSYRNIFTLFFPFILSLALTPLLNYYFTMGYALLLTGSYILSILLVIFLPVLSSLYFTIFVFNYIKRKKPHDSQRKKINNDGFLDFNRREKIGIGGICLLSLSYFLSYFLIPTTLQAKVVDNLFLFILWYISLTVLVMLVITLLHHFIGNYSSISKSEKLKGIEEQIELESHSDINIFMKKDSKDEFNAWIYGFDLFFKRGINIFATEGLLNKFDTDQLKSIFFHEIGHVKLRHTRITIYLSIISTILISIFMFFARKTMLAFGWWQYILLFPFGIVIMVFLSEWLPKKISKIFEHKADEYAVRLLKDKEVYINALLKLNEFSEDEDIDDKKKEWRQTHPSFQKRINYIKDLD